MVSLTTQQRDLLRHILDAEGPVVVGEIAQRMSLTPRQVNYRLKPIKTWLSQHDALLQATPGIGIEIKCSSTRRTVLLNELTTHSNYQLTLSAGERQQLFALTLLTNLEPLTLDSFHHSTAVSRTTILKDMIPIEAWIQRYNLNLIRRPNYGIALEGTEFAKRQAIIALLWGDIPFCDSLTTISHDKGLVFSLAAEAHALPIAKQTQDKLHRWNTQAALEGVAYAEAQLGGRFTDDAVLQLALVFSTQAQRIQSENYIKVEAQDINWLHKQKVWDVAKDILRKLCPDTSAKHIHFEIAAIAMHLLAGIRSHVWPGAIDIESELTELVMVLMDEVAQVFNTPRLRHDDSLRDGLIAHIIPAYMRQRFQLWAPPSWSDGALSRQYKPEYEIACELATIVTERTGVILPDGEIDTLTLLLRAAFIRERPNHPKRVFIICPSGMATAQLLVARLKARFPSLNILGVLSLRELSTERVAEAQLLITTVPLLRPPKPGLPVIEVHPLLMPEDIETITNWLT